MASVVEEAGHGVRDRGGVTWLDTRAMEWEPMPGLPAYRQKVLVRDADGEPSVTLNYVPSQRMDRFAFELPYRHLHRTVREFAYVLEGELISWEYESAAQTRGDVVRKKAGYFMDRRPGSIHGVEAPEPTSATGAVLLCWREGGPGVWLGERGFETETEAVPYGDGPSPAPAPDEPHEAGAACVRNRGGVTWIDTRELEWEPMGAIGKILPGFYQKVLARDADGEPSVTMNYAAPGVRLANLPYRHAHVTVREFSYVLDGEYMNCEWESAEQVKGDWLWKKKGYFMDRRAGSIHGSDVGPASNTGAVFLAWREGGPGIWHGERDFDRVTVEIPFA